jgi:hypothetical protein
MINSALRTLLLLIAATVAVNGATVNRLDCEDSEDGETIHCEFALERRAMRKNIDTCMHIGKESFCVEAKIHTMKRTLAGYDDHEL